MCSSQVSLVGPAAVRAVVCPGCGALGPGEGHIIIQGVPGVRHAAGGAPGGTVQARHGDGSRRRLRAEVRAHDVLDPPLASVLSAAAATDADEHDEAAHDLEYPADVAQDDAVADAHADGRGHRGDLLEDVGVPGDGDDGHDAREEEEQSPQAGHRPVGFGLPAADPRDGHAQADQAHDQGGDHQPLRRLDDLVGEVRGVLQVAHRPLGGRGGPADVPDALLDVLVTRGVGDVVEGPPVGGHGGDEVQDPAAGNHDHPEDQDARRAQGHPDPLLRCSVRHGCCWCYWCYWCSL